MLWYSLEAPPRGASNEYPQHMFLLRNKKDISIFRMKKAPYLLLCESSSKQMIHTKHQVQFPGKRKNIFKMLSASIALQQVKA